MKRQYHFMVNCCHPGCTEVGHYTYDTRKEYSDGYNRHKDKWYCVRHTRPKELLTINNTETEIKLKCIEKMSSYDSTKVLGKFWQEEKDFGTDKCNSGFQFGNGYKAFADDFPVGTILTITSKITFPDK